MEIAKAFEGLSGSWANWMLVSLVESLVLLGLVGLTWIVIRKRVAPQVGMWLFLLVPIKLMMPISIPVPQQVANLSPISWVGQSIEGKAFEQTNRIPNAPTAIAAQFSAAEYADVENDKLALGSVDTNDESTDIHAVTQSQSPPRQSATQPIALPPHSVSINQRAKSRRLPSVAFAVWLIVTLFLLIRFAVVQFRFGRNVRSLARPIEGSALPFDWELACRQVGINGKVPLLESRQVSAPIVCGLLRPAIVIPGQFGAAVSPEQFRWAVLHELAHVKRRDLWFVLLQRVALILNWFNPSVWLANYWADQLREFACDDLASVVAQTQPIESGQAFLEILKFASKSYRQPANALGLFGWNKSPSQTSHEVKSRLQRMIEEGRLIMVRPGKWSITGVMIVALLMLPKLYATSGESDRTHKTLETIESAGKFELLVVDKEDNPVSNASVQIRSNIKFEDGKQVLVGEFIRQKKYGSDFKTDSNGKLSISMPKGPTKLDLYVKTTGYGPFYSPWSTTNSSVGIPAKQKIVLDSAWTIGGIVENENGEPVVGAKVRVSLRFKVRPDRDEALYVGDRQLTDAEGKWRYDKVPVHLSDLGVQIEHEDYRPKSIGLSRSLYEVAAGKTLAKVQLDSGLTITGKITDENGSPIEGALIRSKFMNQKREAKTGMDGAYQMKACAPGMTRVVVSAPGRALDLQEVLVADDMDSVDFQLKPGGKVRLKVVDPEGNPLPKAGFFVQSWRGHVDYFEFDHVKCKTNEEGIWEWNEAPLDSFEGDIYYRGDRGEFMTRSNQSILIGEKLQVFKLAPQLYVSGKVTDAETGEPIKKFRVIPGLEEQSRNLAPDQGFEAKDGTYRLKHFKQSYNVNFVRIEADGYDAAESRDIKPDEGEVVVDFKLKRGTNIVSKILTPAGKPAVGASITVGVSGSQISIENGRIDKSSTYQSPTVESDDGGQFKFPPREKGYHLVILHDSGFAHVITGNTIPVDVYPDSNATRVGDLPAQIELTPWGRIEGSLMAGKEILPNQEVTILGSGIHSYGNGVPNIFTHNNVVTGSDGKFVFDRVMPGRKEVARSILVTGDNGAAEATSSRNEPVILKPGQIANVQVGGSGRAVVGKLAASPDFEGKPLWSFATITVDRYFDGPIEDPPAEVWEDGKERARLDKLIEMSPRFIVTAAKDGAFRIDDMPAGKYRMKVRFYDHNHSAGVLPNYLFEILNDELPEPMDLKVLTLLPDPN